DLDVSFSDRAANLVDEGFDLAVRIGRPADSSLVARKLCEVRIVVVGANAYLERRGEPRAVEDLAEHDCIMDANFREPNRWPLRGPGGEAMPIPVRGRIRYSNAEACLSAAGAGPGLGCRSVFAAAAALPAGRVCRVLE